MGTAVYVTVSSLYHLTSLSFKQTMKFVFFLCFFSLSHSCRNKCALNNISVGTDGHLKIVSLIYFIVSEINILTKFRLAICYTFKINCTSFKKMHGFPIICNEK